MMQLWTFPLACFVLIVCRQLAEGAPSLTRVQPPATNTPPTYVYKCGGPLANITDYDCQTTENKTVLRACYYNGVDNYYSCPQLCEGAEYDSLTASQCRKNTKCSNFLRTDCALEPVIPTTVTVTRPPTNSPPTPKPDNYNVLTPAASNLPAVNKQDGSTSQTLSIIIPSLIFIIVVLVVVTLVVKKCQRPRRDLPALFNSAADRVDLPFGQELLAAAPVDANDVEPENLENELLQLPSPVQESENSLNFNGEGHTQPSENKSGVL